MLRSITQVECTSMDMVYQCVFTGKLGKYYDDVVFDHRVTIFHAKHANSNVYVSHERFAWRKQIHASTPPMTAK